MFAMFPPGTLLNNRYRITRLLNTKGGFGVVYLGEDLMSQQTVAIKQNRDTSQDAREQFRREAELLRPLQHNNLVRVIDYFEDAAGTQFLVMDYIPGDDLWDLARRRLAPFPEAQVLQWGQILCDVLTYLHNRVPPIIHRDIKPHNVKLQPDGRIVLVDFGIAKQYHSGQKTQRGALGVTPGFSPIEQYGIGTATQTDIYSLGASLYFLLTVQMPEDAMERATQKRSLDFQTVQLPLSTLTTEAIAKATAIKPEDRFQSAAEMRQALARAAQALRAPAASCFLTQPCPKCGVANRPNAQFCHSCGMSLAICPIPSRILCPHCGRANRDTARICGFCGKPLTGVISSWRVPGQRLAAQPRQPLVPGHCPKCGQSNPLNETFCQKCGYQLQPTLPGPSQPRQPVPISAARANIPVPAYSPVARSTLPAQVQAESVSERRWVGGVMLATGILALLIGAALFFLRLLPLALFLIGMGVFTGIAGHDLLDPATPSLPSTQGQPAFAFGKANRGRQWATIAAMLWIIFGIATAWLALPLALAGVMVFVLNTLVGERMVLSVGGHFERPGWVTVVGWLLTFSGIGTVPGIGLLIHKPWARTWAIRALGVIAAAGLGGTVLALVGLTAANPPGLLALTWTLAALPSRPVALALLTLSAATMLAALTAMPYLNSVQFGLDPLTTFRRELSAAAWTLFFTGWAAVAGSVLWAGILSWGIVMFWIGIIIGGLAILGARDLLDLAKGWFADTPIAGTMERGRNIGVVATLALAFVSVTLAWQVVPLLFLIIAIFILRILSSPAAVTACGGNWQSGRVILIAWLLIPTGLGTIPGILMMKRETWGWRSACVVWAILLFAGSVVLLGGLIAIFQGYQSNTVIWTMSCAGYAIATSAMLALKHMQSPIIRSYFGIQNQMP